MKSKKDKELSNGKLFVTPPKCPALFANKLTGLFGWRHTYRVHHHQKGISHYNQNLHKTYSLNLPPKKDHETSASNPSLAGSAMVMKLQISFKSIFICNSISVENPYKRP